MDHSTVPPAVSQNSQPSWAAQLADFRRLLIECDTLPEEKKTILHRILEAVGAGAGKTVASFMSELARDVRADAWLAQDRAFDGGDSDDERLQFMAWKRARLLSAMSDFLAYEEAAR